MPSPKPPPRPPYPPLGQPQPAPRVPFMPTKGLHPSERKWITLYMQPGTRSYYQKLAKLRGQSMNKTVLDLAAEGVKRLTAEGKLYPGQKQAEAAMAAKRRGG